jgi:glucose/arabinose dehydrogenase
MSLARSVLFAATLAAFTLTAATAHGDKPAEPPAAKPYGIDKRVELTTSKVVGSPEPPPPYRVARDYAKVPMAFPVFVIHQPGSDRLLLTTETHGYGPTKLQRIKDDPNSAELETVYTWEDGVAYSIEFHPDFARNGQVFVGWNGMLPGEKKKKTRVTRYHMDPKPPYKFDPATALEIISVESDGHNGAALAFGNDGMLYVTTGDGTSDSDTNVVGQKMDTLLAKLLRIDVDHPDGEPGGVSPRRNYSVPKDNPFVGKEGIVPETWAYGFRNPWRLTVDKKTGHIWLGQNGQDLWEQAYLVNKGDNGGWSVMEGSHVFYPNRNPGPTPFVKPTVEHPHSEFRSLTGGIVYYGKKYPELQGAYIYGDYSTGAVWGIKHDGKNVIWHKELAATTLAITSFGTDKDGEILITDHRGKGEGGLNRLEPNLGAREKNTAFPRKLSESGLFRSVKGHIMEPALIPYSVNAQLWSDGAYKARWLGIPGAEPKIDMTGKDGWNFPDKTVAVKSFALEREPGKPETRRWIETRFLTKRDGQWYGYSYVWNDEQTDATLVPKEGMDREYAVGNGKQKWHYPSRTECMVCHSRAANFVLGLSTVQFNKVHDYGGVKDEQLRVLEHLGLVSLSWADDAREAIRNELQKQGKTEKEIKEYLDKHAAARTESAAKEGRLQGHVPAKYKKLVDPYDKTQPLDLRARSYLHANCAICHVDAGGGNAQFNVDFLAKPESVKLFDVKPQHHTFGIKDARLIAPGDPDRSVLLYRVATREQGHMPPLATSLVDREATEMLREWVRAMKATPAPK